MVWDQARQLCATAPTLTQQDGRACISCQVAGAERTVPLDVGLGIRILASSPGWLHDIGVRRRGSGQTPEGPQFP